MNFINEPILVDNHYLVSTRDMADAFGATIGWNEDTKEITVAKDDKQISFKASVIRDAVSYVPLRDIATDLGYTLDWEEELQMMFIYK